MEAELWKSECKHKEQMKAGFIENDKCSARKITLSLLLQMARRRRQRVPWRREHTGFGADSMPQNILSLDGLLLKGSSGHG